MERARPKIISLKNLGMKYLRFMTEGDCSISLIHLIAYLEALDQILEVSY